MKIIKNPFFMKKILVVFFNLIVLVAFCKEIPKTLKRTIDIDKMATLCAPPNSEAELYINNVRTTILNGGDMWWNLTNGKYEVPAGTGKHSLFAGSLWIGGIDGGGQLRVAGQTYRQNGMDWWSGAMDTTILDIQILDCLYYDRHWKVNKQDVLDFISNGTTTADIISWPGNGNSATNEGHYLAPFYDNNGDGIYNHIDGDYPAYNFTSNYPTVPGTNVQTCNSYLFGDQSIWWVINDVGNLHSASGSDEIGLEVRCQAFAFQSSSPAINNATFYQYQIINRSSTYYTNTYFGQWVDPDLGYAVDDYVGCDVGRGLGYCYNGDSFDETNSGYGIDPPAIGVDFLQGPTADLTDGVDNDRDGCIDCTFIDSSGTVVIYYDDVLPEQISITSFINYTHVNNSPTGIPNGFTGYYNYLRGVWLDNQPMTFGGDGRNPLNPIYTYMYPGTSDPFNPTNWSELSVGNIPGERTFVQSAGPYSMEPGEVDYVTTSVVWAQQTGGGPLGSLALLQQYDDEAQQLFSNCFRLIGVGIDEIAASINISVHPNPSSDFVMFENSDPSKNYNLKIFSSTGQLVLTESNTLNGNYKWETSTLPKGTYIYEISSADKKLKAGKIVLY
jgi:hypothetical protein